VDLELEDKICVVSGSSRGIGKAIAETLLKEGAKVCLNGRESQILKNTFTELQSGYPGKIQSVVGDINCKSVLEEIRRSVIEQWGRIDHLVANAGSVRPVTKAEMDDEDWDWYLQSNLRVAYHFVSFFLSDLRESKGSVVFIGSIAGLEEVGAPIPYSVAKAALLVYAKGLSRKVADDGIRINAINPGNVIFPGGNWEEKLEKNRQGVEELLNQKVPLNRFGKPEEIAAATAFLLSPRASFITGCSLTVDGGQTTKLV
jgi:3-oxoacyl-[acyl-carrier protein] reductase